MTRAKKQGGPNKRFSVQGWDASHYQKTEAYVAVIDKLYNEAIAEFARLAMRTNIDPDKPFSFADYPSTSATAQNIINGLASNMQAVIEKGSRNEWLYACKKNDEFLQSIMNTSKVGKRMLSKMQDRNLDALDAFQKRKVNGLDLSKRVWKYAGQFKKQWNLELMSESVKADPHNSCRKTCGEALLTRIVCSGEYVIKGDNFICLRPPPHFIPAKAFIGPLTKMQCG